MGITFASILQVSRCGPGHPDPQGHCLIVERTKRKKKKKLAREWESEVDCGQAFLLYYIFFFSHTTAILFLLYSETLDLPIFDIKKSKKKKKYNAREEKEEETVGHYILIFFDL